MSDEPATLGELGEAAVLARILPRLPRSAGELLGAGDDAAVVAAPDGRTVVTTDLLVHGPDFRWGWSSPRDLGIKAAASNLADVAAMGARPTALVVALAAPASTPIATLEGLADGLREGCEALAPGCGVVGGDLSVSPTFTVAVTAFGDLEGRAPVTRAGARPGDVAAIAGVLGEAAAGLRLLFENARGADGSPDARAAARLAAEHPRLIAAQLRPAPPIGAGIIAARGGATAMMDLSDGLAIDAGRLARASGVALDLDAAALGDDVELALGGGEDHSLLATFAGSPPAPFRVIGRVVAGAGLRLDGEPIDDRGWDPYADWDGVAG